MLISATGDWHIKHPRPKNRTDENYSETIFRKIENILKESKNCSCILQAADMFDTFKLSNVPHYLVRKIADLLLKHCWDNNIKIFSQRGQHDLRFRSDVNDTPLGILEIAEIVWIAKEENLSENVMLYGCGYMDEIPYPKDKNKFNILLVHKMIVEDGPLWPGQKDYFTAKSFLKKYPYDLVVSGDNHNGFISEYRDRTLINCGSLMRTNISQFNHKPFFVIFDTDTRKYEIKEIPIDAAEEVLKLEEAVYDKNQKIRLDSFIKDLESRIDSGKGFNVDYLEESEKIAKEENLDVDVWVIFKEAYNESKEDAN